MAMAIANGFVNMTVIPQFSATTCKFTIAPVVESRRPAFKINFSGWNLKVAKTMRYIEGKEWSLVVAASTGAEADTQTPSLDATTARDAVNLGLSLFSKRREKLQAIEKDQKEYTLDEEENREREVLLKSDCTLTGSMVLKKSLSRRYPDMAFEEALQTENEKLQEELQRLESCHETEQCDVVKHLIDFTEAAVTVTSESGELKFNKSYRQADYHSDDVHQSEDGESNLTPDAKIRKSHKNHGKCAVM